MRERPSCAIEQCRCQIIIFNIPSCLKTPCFDDKKHCDFTTLSPPILLRSSFFSDREEKEISFQQYIQMISCLMRTHPKERQRQTDRARTGFCHGCEEILLSRRRDGGRQRHIEADAEKCERVSVRLVMTRLWLRRAGEAAALALTHLIPTGPPG